MISRLLCLLSFFLIISGAALAKDAPEIKLRDDNELGDYVTEGLVVEHLGLIVDVRAGLAQVSMTATLRNETDEDTEARFSYPLPDGAVINGYALDIGGTLVDGVLMPKERAETLYTDRVTASIDPGIAARTVDNRYQTRIYPIAADGGTRQIRLDFAVPVPVSGLRLPFSQSQAVEHVTIEITGDGADEARSSIDDAEARDVKLTGDVFIPAAAGKASLSTHSGQRFLTLPLAAQTDAVVEEISSIAVIWDTSFSRDAGEQAAERRFIGDVLSRLAPQRQSLIYGADKIDLANSFETPSQLEAALGRITYDGATNLSALLDADVLSRRDIRSDICLVITDGHSTLGASGLPNLPCRVFTFSADKNPNTDWLALIAARNAGMNLSGLSASEAARRMTTGGGPQLAAGQTGEIVSVGERQWLILPVEADTRTLSVRFKTGTTRLSLRTLKSKAHPAAGSIWGQRRIAELQTRGAQGFDAVVDASRRWNVQTKETAFLVLEDSQDYIEAQIDPPRSFPAELMSDYKEELAEAQEEEAEELAEHLDNLRDDWEDQIEWWETDWSASDDEDKDAKFAPSPPAELAMPAPPPAVVSPDDSALASDTITMTATRRDAEEAEVPLADMGCDDCDYVIVTGARRFNPAGELPAEIKIETRAWTPDRPFLTALKDLEPEVFESEYFQQRKAHGDRPSFYLEVADQLYRDGKTDRAARMAATALDLKSATPITRNNVADRLLMYGQTQDAIALYRDVLPSSQDRPQPYYNLALALIQAGDNGRGTVRETFYREAFEHLIHVINSPWEDDYEGIHLIALQGLNRSLARLPKSTRKKFQKELGLDKLFYKNLPVDIRILIDWTANDADLDIHVIERVGADDEETAYFSNPATERGGRVSNDMTEGYGPEEYMIRRAPNGLYRVESDYFRQDAYTEDGALKLRARLWRNYGRKTETYQTVIIEMLEEKEDAYILGEIQVGPKTDTPVAAGDETE